MGRSLRALRVRRGWRQVDLAMRAGVSRALISNLERGMLRQVSIRVLMHVVEALGADLDVRIRWRGEALDRLLDEVHALVVDEVVRTFRAAGWEVVVEASFSIWGERGRIDVLAFHSGTRSLAVGEIKSAIADSQDTIGDLDRKTRLAPDVVAERGWQPASVSRVLFVADRRAARRRVEELATTFGSTFPVRGPAVKRWIQDPSGGAISGLMFVSYATGRGARRTVGSVQRVRQSKSTDDATLSGLGQKPAGGPRITPP